MTCEECLEVLTGEKDPRTIPTEVRVVAVAHVRTCRKCLKALKAWAFASPPPKPMSKADVQREKEARELARRDWQRSIAESN